MRSGPNLVRGPQFSEFGVDRRTKCIKCLACSSDLLTVSKEESLRQSGMEADLDIIHNDILRIQQEPKLGFILLLECALKVFFILWP